jgi:hypothetical protein
MTISRSLVEYGDLAEEFDLARLADSRVATRVCEELEERHCSGGMRFQLYTAYLRCLGYLSRRCSPSWVTVSDEVVHLIVECRESASADRNKEGVRARRRTIPDLIRLGRWLPLEKHLELQTKLEKLLADAVQCPPVAWADIMEFQDVLITWVHACRHHSAQRVQVYILPK